MRSLMVAGSAKLATPPPTGITKPAASARRRRAARLASAISCASARSIRPARPVPQNRGDRLAGMRASLAPGAGPTNGPANETAPAGVA